MSDTASKMSARIWVDEVDGDFPVAYLRADVVWRLTEALRECQLALAALTTLEEIKATNDASAWVNCVAAEAKARSALTSYREASNVES